MMKTITIQELLNYYPVGTSFVGTEINGKTVYIHDMIMQPPKACVVIHKNKDTLDNRTENLAIRRLVNGYVVGQRQSI